MKQYNIIEIHKDKKISDTKNELLVNIARWTSETDQLNTEIPELSYYKYEGHTEPITFMYEPSICVAIQGAKRVSLGDDIYVYDAHHYLITSVNLPAIYQVIEASKEKPYLGLMLKLDLKAVSQMMVDSHLPSPKVRKASRGIAVSEISEPLLNAFQRLMDLLDSPEDIPILSPLIQHEILYRLLIGDQGQRLRQIAMAGSHSHQIARAVNWLKECYTKPIHVQDLAAISGMSTSTFHHHFRALTAMSPLQYQKWMRLHEARRLMLTDNMDAATAAFKVGYESPSQFSREYSRLFGAPPLRDIKNMAKNAVN